MIKLDYKIESPEERKKLVEQILEENPNPSEQYLEILADYLVLCMEKKEKKERKILTDNRKITMNKRETSFEGFTEKIEGGEDCIYNLIQEDKNVIFRPKDKITKKDLEEIPFLRQLHDAIEAWEEKSKTVEGKDAYIYKHALIEMRKDQYIIRDGYRKPIRFTQITPSKAPIYFEDTTSEFTSDNRPIYSGASFMDPNIVSLILSNYSKLKQDGWGDFVNDTWYFMLDFDKLAGEALAPYPFYARLVELKVDGLPNIEIQKTLFDEFGATHSIEYISTLWKNKIPKIIADKAEDQFLEWYFSTQEKGVYKKCNRCGQVKLANSKYFSKNSSSKDGWYSICKECRNKNKKFKQIPLKTLK